MTDQESTRERTFIARAIRIMRLNMGLTQLQFADLIGRTPTTIVRYEGNYLPSRSILARLSSICQKNGWESLSSFFFRAAEGMAVVGEETDFAITENQEDPRQIRVWPEILAYRWITIDEPEMTFKRYIEGVESGSIPIAWPDPDSSSLVAAKTPEPSQDTAGPFSEIEVRTKQEELMCIALLYLLRSPISLSRIKSVNVIEVLLEEELRLAARAAEIANPTEKKK